MRRRSYIPVMPSRTERAVATSGPRLQAATGLALTAAIFAAWLGLHLYAMFGFDLTRASLPLAFVKVGIVAVR